MECCKSNPKDRPKDMVQVDGRLKTVQNLWRQKLEGLKASKRASMSQGPDLLE